MKIKKDMDMILYPTDTNKFTFSFQNQLPNETI